MGKSRREKSGGEHRPSQSAASSAPDGAPVADATPTNEASAAQSADQHPARPTVQAERDAAGRVVQGNLGEVFGELRSTLDADVDGDKRYLEGEQVGVVNSRWPVSTKFLKVAGLVALWIGVTALLPVELPESLAWLDLFGEEPKNDNAALFRTPETEAKVGEATLRGSTEDQQDRANELDAPLDGRGPLTRAKNFKIPDPVKEGKPPRDAKIEDPSDKALDALFAKLMRVENKEPGAVARILYYGDSIIATDFITGKLRRLLQTRFGDSGHGYANIANAFPGYLHIDVSRSSTPAWKFSTCVGPYADDAFYGLGCASFVSYYPGNWTQFGTATVAEWGTKVSSYELEYLKQPDGGPLEIYLDGDKHSVLETAADSKELAWHRIEVDDGPHKLKLKTTDKRSVRLFGIRMERAVPGVTVSALGITGGGARFLDKQDNAHFAAVVKAAKPDLVVLAFGGNEVGGGSELPMDMLERTNAVVMEQIEKAVPDASYLLAGPLDMSEPGGQISFPRVPIVNDTLRKIAAERGWAFWDQFRVMGGAGSMRLWMDAGLGNKDGFHPTGQGGSMLGHWEYQALMMRYEQYKAARR